MLQSGYIAAGEAIGSKSAVPTAASRASARGGPAGGGPTGERLLRGRAPAAVYASYVVPPELAEKNGVATQPFGPKEIRNEAPIAMRGVPRFRASRSWTACCGMDGRMPPQVGAAGVSPRSVGKWVRRFRHGAWLEDRSSRPGPAAHMGRFRQAGHRVHGNRQRCSTGAGWEYVHVAVDDHTRLAYVEVLGDRRGPSCAGVRGAGPGVVSRARHRQSAGAADNGSGYVSTVFRRACAALTVRHLRTRPYTPRTNGKAERFIQTLLGGWAYVQPYATSRDRRQALRPWVRFRAWQVRYPCGTPQA